MKTQFLSASDAPETYVNLSFPAGIQTACIYYNSTAELAKLIEAANRVCERKGNKPELVVLRRLS